MERVIERYLKAKHELIINEKMNGSDDLYLELPMKGGPMPAYRITIDTQPMNKTDAGVITERGVRVQMMTKIIVPASRRVAVLEVLNSFNLRKVFSAVYIDGDGEVILDWTLNVMEPGLHTEYVFDMIARENKLWRELYPLVTAALQ
jgi:hypothetical protein